MESVNGSITHEEEKQTNEINEATAKLVFNIRYLVVPMFIYTKLKLSGNEAIIYAFILSWMGDGDGKRFYFTNEQLAGLFNVGESTVKRTMAALSAHKLIRLRYKRKSNGGQIRFIDLMTGQNDLYQRVKMIRSNGSKRPGSNNNISNDKKSIAYLPMKKGKNISFREVAEAEEGWMPL